MPQIWPMDWVLLLALLVLTFMIYFSSIYFIAPQLEFSHEEEGRYYMQINLAWKW